MSGRLHVRSRRPGPAGAVLLGVGALLVGVTGCAKDEFADRTAEVTIAGRAATYGLDSCGLDGTTVFVVGRTPSGRVLQAVVGVEDDGTTGVPASTGLSITGDDVSVAASGAESWSRRGMSGRAPGTITSARVRGSRIQVAGTFEDVDVDGRPPAVADPAEPTPAFTVDARCDLSED